MYKVVPCRLQVPPHHHYSHPLFTHQHLNQEFLSQKNSTNHPLTVIMRFAAIIAALAVTATALPATTLEQTGAALGM
jgi:hypothetical protein